MVHTVSDILKGTVIWILLLPLSLPFIVLLLAWRLLSTLAVYLFYPDIKESLNFYDTFAGVSEIGLMISYALHAKDKIDIVKLRDHFYNTFLKGEKHLKFPVFFYDITTVLGYGYKKKVVEKIDLEYHIREVSWTRGKDYDDLDKALFNLMGENDRLRGNLPKWEIVVIHLEDENKSILLFKISHVLADAYSYFCLLNKLTGNEPPPNFKGHGKSLLYKIGILLKAPWIYWQYRQGVIKGCASKFPFGSDIKSKRGISKGFPFPKLLSSTTVDLQKLKQIARNTGTKVLHVLMTIHFHALKLAAERVGEMPLSEENVKEPVPVTFIVPKPNHPAISKGKSTNHLAWGSFNLTLNSEGRIPLLRKIQKACDHLLDTDSPVIVDGVYSCMSFLLPRTWIIIYECSLAAEHLYLVTPFISAEHYKILGIDVNKLQLLFNGDDINYATGMAFGSITKGDHVEFTLAASHELFLNIEELEHHVKEIMVNELDKLLEESVGLKKNL